MKPQASCLAWLLAIVGALLAMCSGGCGASLPSDGMTKFASMLEATKAGWTLVCQPPPPEPKPAAQCDLAGAYINSAIGVYTELNEDLK